MLTLDQMTLRQKILGNFGEFALRSDSLDEILYEACRLVSEALDADLSKILEIEEGGRTFLIRAGIGWDDGVVGRRLRFSDRSSETFSLQSGEPVISQDITKEERFEFASFLVDHRAVSLVNVPIFLPGGKPYGLLQVDSRSQTDFGDQDIQFLRTYATILGPVIDRLHKKAGLEMALEKNRRLLAELQHRVKNHIGLIASLVRVRLRAAKSEEARRELSGIADRIEILRLLHDHLHHSDDVEHIPLRPFLSRLLENLCRLHGEQTGGLGLDLDLAEADLTPDEAVPLGLIANEFVTNSLKYAFGTGGGTISASSEISADRLRLRLSDDGSGMPPDPRPTSGGSGTGVSLIESLAGQLDAKLSWPASERGTVLELEMRLVQD